MSGTGFEASCKPLLAAPLRGRDRSWSPLELVVLLAGQVLHEAPAVERTERTLHESEERLRWAFEEAPIGSQAWWRRTARANVYLALH